MPRGKNFNTVCRLPGKILQTRVSSRALLVQDSERTVRAFRGIYDVYLPVRS